MFWFVAGVIIVVAVPVLWYLRVRNIRRKFVNMTPGSNTCIPGSDNPPLFDYFIHGFMGRNTNAPYGDFELSFFLGFPCVLVSEPSVIKEISRGAGVKDFDKGEMTLAGVELIAGRQNLFSSDGSHWQHQRLIINPAFRPNFVKSMTPIVTRVVRTTVDSWRNQPPEDLGNAISNLTLDIICQTAFGQSGITQAEDTHPVAESYKIILTSLMWKMLGCGCFADNQLNKAKDDIERNAKRVLEKYRNHQQSYTDQEETCLLSLLLSSQKSNEGSEETLVDADDSKLHLSSTLSEREIIDNIKIFLFAGHDSTATTILWVLYVLALHPRYEDMVHQEIAVELSGLDDSIELGSVDAAGAAVVADSSFEALKKLTFLQCVLKETLRLFPPAWAINRSPKRDLHVGGYLIPKGTAIMINTLRLHRRADLGWERPHDFWPERWDTTGSDEAHHSKASFCYMPFGGGPRTCVGQPLAEVEVLAVLSAILKRFHPEIVGGKRDCEIDFFAGSTIRPKNLKNLRLVSRG